MLSYYVLFNFSVDLIFRLVWFGLWYLSPLSKNISVISWRSILLAEETGGSGENNRPVESH